MILGCVALPSPGPVPTEPTADVPWLVWARVAEAAVLGDSGAGRCHPEGLVGRGGAQGGDPGTDLSVLPPHPPPPLELPGRHGERCPFHQHRVPSVLSSPGAGPPVPPGKGGSWAACWGAVFCSPFWYAVGVTEWKLIAQGRLPPSLHQGTQLTWRSGSPEQGGLGHFSEGGQSRGRFWRGWRVWSASSWRGWSPYLTTAGQGTGP